MDCQKEENPGNYISSQQKRIFNQPVNRKKQHNQNSKNCNSFSKSAVRARSVLKKFWHSGKHQTPYTTFTPDIIKAVSTEKTKLDNEKEKESY
jgi:hypothetical protein